MRRRPSSRARKLFGLAVAAGVVFVVSLAFPASLVDVPPVGLQALLSRAAAFHGPDLAPAVPISPADEAQAVVNAHPAGTVFRFGAGVHRSRAIGGTMIVPRAGDVFVGEPGAVLSGAKLLTSWRREGALWVADGQTQAPNPTAGSDHCKKIGDARYQACEYAEDLYVDDVPVWQVVSLGEVVPGTWYFDYSGDRIYMGSDPTGRRVEVSQGRYAFQCPAGTCPNVTVRGLTVEKFANPAQTGAVQMKPNRGWLVEDSVLRLNHGAGVNVHDLAVVRRNVIEGNGQLGLHGSGAEISQALIEGNEIAYNNYAGYSDGWEAGGFKFATSARNLTFRNNYVHHNQGPGMWTDYVSEGTVYEGNRVEYNASMGIEHEISLGAVIRNNVVRYNGTVGMDAWAFGAQIMVQNSSNVEVYGNVVVVGAGSGDGITVVQQNRVVYGSPRPAVDNYIHDNEVWYLGNVGQSGIFADSPTGTAPPLDKQSAWSRNRFDRNIYHAPRLDSSRWETNGSAMNWAAFRAAGQEPNGTANTDLPAVP